MSLTDPISDMITIIRNANRAKHDQADVKRSHFSTAVLEVLKKERFIYDYKPVEDSNQGIIRVYLKPPAGVEGQRVRRLTAIRRISKPGLRVYATRTAIPRVLNGLGVCVVSTSKGVMTGEQARKNRVGGEVLLKVW